MPSSIKLVAALAATVFASTMQGGAGLASADVFCEANETPCGGNNTYPSETTILALSSNVQLLSHGNETVCHSELEAAVGESLGGHQGVDAEVTALGFSECEGDCEFFTEDAAENLPYRLVALAADPSWHVVSGGGGDPAALMNNCSPFNFDCLYEAPAFLFQLLPGLNPTLEVDMKWSRSTLAGHSNFCPETSGWHATYVVSTPTPIWLSALP